MFKISWICDSGLRRNPIRAFLLFAGLLMLLGAFFAPRQCVAQSMDDTGDQSYDQQSYQSLNQQTEQMSDQDLGLTPDQDNYQMPGQQTNQPWNQQSDLMQFLQPDQTQYQQAGQMQYQQSGQTQNQQPGQGANQFTVSAEQLISILEMEPLILRDVRLLVARRSGDLPSKITNETVYERIRQDASLRTMVTKLLIMRGYGPDLVALNENQAPHENPTPSRNQAPNQNLVPYQNMVPYSNVTPNGNPPNTGNVRPPGIYTRQAPNPAPTPPQPYRNQDNPQVQQGLSPYRNMPSLTDLYSQFPVTRTKLRRFGSDAFLVGNGNANGLGNANQVPIDLPAGPDYVLGPGDRLIVNIWGGRSSRLSRIIDRQGQIELPEAGTVMIDGMTIARAEVAIQKALDTQFQGEHVEISLGQLRTVRVYVVGDVQRPGAYDVSSLSTPLSALYAAGGPTNHGSLRILRQYRGKQLVRQFDLYDFLLRGVRSNDDRLLPGDTILVPPAGPQVSIEGMVRRPAIYELNGEQGLNQVLDLAGGLLVSADLKQIRVERIEAQQKRTMLSLQIPDNNEEMAQKLAAFKVQDGDDVVISQIMPYNEQAVYLAGHVFHPGKYPYRDGMTINDLLHSYQDVMPEPADRAELIRLEPPDLRPVTIGFNLSDALIGNDPIPLHPFDLIRIYGRYESDAPNVVINGEVLRPGKYPMAKGMTVTDLVRMAGGLRRSAYTAEADLSSYNIVDGQRILINHIDVAVQKALDGDKSTNVELKPGDVVNIRALAGWQDIGATVTIRGEVEHAGSYGIMDGEHLSSVLKRAGGFRKDAYPYAAVLNRVQVSELNEQVRQQMINRIEETPVAVSPSAASSAESAEDIRKSLEMQRQQILANLRSRPVNGRLVIDISSDISKWENTPADIEMRTGDTLLIPKRPEFVVTSGQVYNPVAITYIPGKTLSWYLRKAGGPTRSANKKDIYVLRADGSVVPHDSGWLASNFMSMHMRPGDTIFVPEKIVGASQVWERLAASAQTLTALMIPLAITGVL